MKKIIICSIVLLAIAPFVSSATSSTYSSSSDSSLVEELRAQIASLTAQIKQLQAQLGQQTGSSSSAGWCHTFNTDLGVGSSGDDVYALSLALQNAGFNLGKFDGYDENAASAVSSFQLKYKKEILTPAGLSAPTGYLGARTRAKLNALYGCGNSNTAPASKITPSPVACTMEAKMCPDGLTSVGRVGPKCEFAACPSTKTSTQYSVAVLYPNGGEQFLIEKGAFMAKWNSNGQNVNLYLTDYNGVIVQGIGSNISGESLGVTVNADVMQKDVNKFKLKACLANKVSLCDSSNEPFSFVSSLE